MKLTAVGADKIRRTMGENTLRVNAVVTKSEIMGALRDATIDNEYFDVDDWCERDAEIFITIAGMIERELASKRLQKSLMDGRGKELDKQAFNKSST